MSGSRRRGSILALGAVLLVAGACSSTPETATSGTSTPAVTATARPGSTVTNGDGGPEGGGEGPGTTVGPTPETGATTTTTTSAGPTPSVPIVDPASVEAFCALDQQLEDLSDAQMHVEDLDDPEALRLAFAAFVTDNAAVIDQYVAAAPPEIEADVDETMSRLRAAIDDPAAFEDTLSGDTEASDRVSAFIDANCPD